MTPSDRYFFFVICKPSHSLKKGFTLSTARACVLSINDRIINVSVVGVMYGGRTDMQQGGAESEGEGTTKGRENASTQPKNFRKRKSVVHLYFVSLMSFLRSHHK